MKEQPEKMQAMIFAAGLGTRLKPLTDTRPKALVEIDGKPLLEIVIDRLVNAGIRHIVVNVHHFAPMIKQWLNDHPREGVTLLVSDESEQLLETGGGIKKARPLFLPDVPILIHNVDILSNVDLRRFYIEHQQNDAALLVSERKTKRYLLFDSAMKLTGWQNVETGEVKSPHAEVLQHADELPLQRFAFSGIHLFSPRLFPLMDDFPDRFGIIDFYLKVCAERDIHGFEHKNLRMIDVGKLDTLAKAEQFYRETHA